MAGVLACFLLDLAINLVAWVISSWLQTDHFYDLTGALSYVVVGLFSLLGGAGKTAASGRGTLATAMVLVWAVRLGTFLFTRVRKAGHDRRLDKYKTNPKKFLVLWVAQTVWVFMNLLPVLIINAGEADVPLGAAVTDWPALAGWAVGFACEVIADHQKSAFRALPANAHTFIRSGLWAASRHPNYFGQILLTSSLALFCLPAMGAGDATPGASTLSAVLHKAQALAVLAPAFETWLLLRVSGVPLLEKQAEAKWGGDPAYRTYVQHTPVVVPSVRKLLGMRE